MALGICLFGLTNSARANTPTNLRVTDYNHERTTLSWEYGGAIDATPFELAVIVATEAFPFAVVDGDTKSVTLESALNRDCDYDFHLAVRQVEVPPADWVVSELLHYAGKNPDIDTCGEEGFDVGNGLSVADSFSIVGDGSNVGGCAAAGGLGPWLWLLIAPLGLRWQRSARRRHSGRHR